jgi:hypothetical protein
MQTNDDKILPEPDPGSHVSQIQSGDWALDSYWDEHSGLQPIWEGPHQVILRTLTPAKLRYLHRWFICLGSDPPGAHWGPQATLWNTALNIFHT